MNLTRTIASVWFCILLPVSVAGTGCSSSEGENDADADVHVEVEVPDGDEGESGNECSTDYDCSDGIFCNGVERCVGGLCEDREEPDCADGFTCTEDSCDEELNTCRHDYKDELCNDGNVCNGLERCMPRSPFSDGETGCVAGSTVFCEDDNDCTEDFCDPESGECGIRIRDVDRDGYGDKQCSLQYTEGVPTIGTDCYDPDNPDDTPEEGTICKGTDCDDGNDEVHPDAEEVCGDGIDNNCDRMVDLYDETCFPGNDTCATPQELPSDGGSVTGSIRGTADDYTTGCGAPPLNDVVFLLDLADDHDVGLSAFGDFSAFISVRTECSSVDSEVYCGENSIWARGLEAGTYYIIVEGDTPGNFSLSVELAPYTDVYNVPPTNDDCSNPYILPPEGGLFIGETTGMANDFTASCGSSSASPDAAFELTLTDRKMVTVSTVTTVGYDGTIHMHSAPCDGGAEIACNDDCPDTRHSCFTTTVDAGTYYIIVDGYSSSASGNYEMNVVITDPP